MLFQKTNSIKSTSPDTPLRKSDRRKLSSQIHQINNTTNLQELLQDVITSNNNSDILKRKLLIGKSTNKFKKNCTLYFRTPNTDKKDDVVWKFNRTIHPIFLEVDTNETKLFVPCLSILSIIPNILPTVYIHSGTSKYICRGANLMSVGIISPSIVKAIHSNYELPTDIGNLVSVCVYGNPIPFGVGIWEGMEGNDNVAVSMILGYGDDLWRMQYPKDGVQICDGEVDDGNYGNCGFIDGTHVLPIVGEETQLDTTSNQNDESEQNQETNEDTNNDHKEEINEKVIHLFYKSLLHLKQSNLPIPISTFYIKYYKPTLQEENVSLDLTPFKKLSHLLLFLQRDYFDDDDFGFGLSEDRNLLCTIDTSHFYYREVKKLYGSLVSSQNSTADGKRKVTTVSLYVIPNHIIDRMELSNEIYDVKANKVKNEIRRGTGYLTLNEIRDILFQYCTIHNLDNKSSIQLNGTLQYVFYASNKTLKQKYNTKEIKTTTSKKEILELWKDCLDPVYAIVKLPMNEITSMKRGSTPPKIQIVVEKRNNKKYTSTITGLEAYNIDSTLFSSDLSKRFGCSCSTTNEKEVVVQGNVSNDVQYLLSCGMDGSSVHGNVLDFSTGNGKFLLNYEDFVIPKGVCQIVLRKGVKAKKN